MELITYTPNAITQMSEQDTSELYAKVKAYEKELTNHKEAKTKPINDALKKIRADYKPQEELIDQILTSIKSHLVSLKQSRDSEPRNTLEIAPVLATTYRQVQKLQINDKNLVPHEYMDVNEAAVKKAIQSGIVVPGCEIIYQTQISL